MIFQEFKKIPRLNRDIIITEKIDGTNAAVVIEQGNRQEYGHLGPEIIAEANGLIMMAQSRSRFITPLDDNFGFAKWVEDNATELFKLGPGVHFGEWWGKGINKRYHMVEGKRFSLFNTHKWSDEATRPACCGVVPVLYSGPFIQAIINAKVELLRNLGSFLHPDAKAEGIIVYHTAAQQYFKVTCEKDESYKGAT